MGLIEELGDDPLKALRLWIADAARTGTREPNAMALGTVDAEGRPSVRIVLAKGVERDTVQFFTNYESRKAGELAVNPRSAATFHWVDAARQVRLEGEVRRTSPEVSRAYFATRPRGSQLAAWASAQSKSIATYDELVRSFREVESRFGVDGDVPCPPHWGGYELTPRMCEFWLGKPNRMHDRVVFERSATGWVKRQVAP